MYMPLERDSHRESESRGDQGQQQQQQQQQQQHSYTEAEGGKTSSSGSDSNSAQVLRVLNDPPVPASVSFTLPLFNPANSMRAQ